MLQFIPVIGGLIKTAGGLFENWQKRKLIKAEGKVKLEQAIVDGKVNRANAVVGGEIEYDQIAAEGMKHSWKDEWFTILLSIPVMMCFIPIPEVQNAVKEGFIILKDSTPEWFQYCFIGAIVASFGLKTWMNRRVQ